VTGVMMSVETIRMALGRLQDDPENEAAWNELAEAVTAPGVSNAEVERLLGAARPSTRPVIPLDELARPAPAADLATLIHTIRSLLLDSQLAADPPCDGHVVLRDTSFDAFNRGLTTNRGNIAIQHSLCGVGDLCGWLGGRANRERCNDKGAGHGQETTIRGHACNSFLSSTRNTRAAGTLPANAMR